MTTFITRLDASGSGPRLAVKDLIDVEGVPTTAGSRAVERSAKPAEADAPCLRGARAAGARVVGKANLHELAMLPFGTNPWFGTPVNPLDSALIPGGSSSGSAVAVATGPGRVYIRALDRFEPSIIPGSEGAQSPFFSPDASRIAFFARGRLLTAAVAGGAPGHGSRLAAAAARQRRSGNGPAGCGFGRAPHAAGRRAADHAEPDGHGARRRQRAGFGARSE